MADLGDIGGFMRGAAVSDLSWLDVDDEQYRQLDRLPKQNLDTVPDLEAAWAHEDKGAAAFVPNRAAAPRTMGDMSEAHGLLRASPSDIRKAARLALLQSPDLRKFQATLKARFDLTSLKEARSVIADVLAERGLLGHLYVDAADFNGCHTGSPKVGQFVRRYAAEARYVVAKPRCAGCVHAHTSPKGGETCSVFHKEIKVEVPYTSALAEEVEALQEAKGKAIQATDQPPKERIRLAMLAPVQEGYSPLLPRAKESVQRLLRPVEEAPTYQKPEDLSPLRKLAQDVIGSAFQEGRLTLSEAQGAYRKVASSTTANEIRELHVQISGVEMPEQAVYHGAGTQAPVRQATRVEADQQLIAASSLTRKRDEETRKLLAAKKAQPVISLLRREMLKGRTEGELLQSLKYAFAAPDLEATREHWEPLFKESGLYGVVYATQTSFAECREGADFLAKHNASVKVMIAGPKCGGCIYNKIGRCLMYGKPLVATVNEAITPAVVDQVLADHKAAGRIASWDRKASWGATPREALKNIHLASLNQGTSSVAETRYEVVKAFSGQRVEHALRDDTRREIVTAARRHLNDGLYGRDLLSALKSRFESRDLVAATPDLRPVIAEQGLQGIYFVDPTAYADYGRGCDEASRLYRSRGIPYAKMGSKCGSCVLQTRNHCSKLNKPLVGEVPYPADRATLQREVLASGRATETDPAKLVNNGRSMMAEYEVQNRGMEIDLNDVVTQAPVQVSFK